MDDIIDGHACRVKKIRPMNDQAAHKPQTNPFRKGRIQLVAFLVNRSLLAETRK